MLCCLALAIFGIKEVPTDGVDFDTGDFAGVDDVSMPPMEYTPPASGQNGVTDSGASDPELEGKVPITTPATIPLPATLIPMGEDGGSINGLD